MTDEQISQAIRFDRKQGFAKDEVQLIQRVVGVEPDGLWGKETVEGVWRWQQSQGIPPDGKVWRSHLGNTWPRIQEAARESAPSFRLGVWVDDPPSQVLEDQFADSLQELGVSAVAIMVNDANTVTTAPGWTPRWTVQQLAEAGRLLLDRRIDLVLTAWPRPSYQQLATLLTEMEEAIAASGAVALELDVEGNWKSGFLEGFASLEEAGRYLAGELRSRLSTGIRLELTTYPYHAEFSSQATLSPYLDVLLPQAYSVYKASDPQTFWGASLGPGDMQTLAIGRASQIQGPQVACGLAAYFQDRYPDHSAAEAMRRALDAVAARRVEEIRYWSSKWIVGAVKNDYSQAFLAEIGKASDFRLQTSGSDPENSGV